MSLEDAPQEISGETAAARHRTTHITGAVSPEELRQQIADEMLAGAMILALQADLDALRARVVVAEEDADRLAPLAAQSLSYKRGQKVTPGYDTRNDEYLAEAEAAIDAHRVAVEGRPE